MNLQSTNQGNKKGTHWLALKCINNCKFLEYVDSFGFSTPITITIKEKVEIFYSYKGFE